MPVSKKFLAFLFCLVLTAGFFAYQPRTVLAQAGAAIPQPTITLKDLARTVSEMKAKLLEASRLADQKAKEALKHSITANLANTARTLLNQFAYETATYIGSGSDGQKPKYYIDSFGPWLNKQINTAGGQFIEDLSYNISDKDYINKYGICAPDFSVQVKLSLGLTDYSKESRGLTESQCNLARLRSSIENAALTTRDRIALWSEPGYLGNLASTSFDPVSTDIGISMLQFGKLDLKKELEAAGAKLTRSESLGWLNIDTFTGKIDKHPGNSALRINSTQELMAQNFGKTTGDLLVDASNIFLNQLAMTAFQTLMGSLSKKVPSGTLASDYYGQGNTGGVTEVQRKNNSILQAKFTVQADYNVLGQLSTCGDENNAGPTNCVIQQPFVQAITNRLTVAEAIDQGLLNGRARVGYKANGDDLSFKEGYPYRSLIILRKYRILPVGWEMAAEYIKTHPGETQSMDLNALVACYADNTKAPWCRGLIDPHWVLKLPEMFCGMEGYGAQILTANAYQNQEVDSVTQEVTTSPGVAVSHIDNYCADEQSCIKEAANGTCLQYGYCTAEKRQWVFDAAKDNSCEPLNNTCQTFEKGNGESVSYLENTLDYSDCDASQVGCKRYASLADAYNKDTDVISWNKTAGQLNFNKDISQCQADGEGCHEFIRFSDSAANLVADGSFEQSTCVKEAEIPTEGDAGPGSGSGSGASLGGCLLTSIAAPGAYLTAPNSHWYLRARGPLNAGIVTDKSDHGGQSLYIAGNGGVYSNDSSGASLLPAGFAMEPDTYYVLQASIYVEAGKVKIGFGDGPTGLMQETTDTGSWVPYTLKFYNSAGSTVHDFFIEGTDASARFYVDGIQLSKSSTGSNYTEYGESDIIYEKLLPAYLEATCYVAGSGGSGSDSGGSGDIQYQLKPDAPQVCYKYARKCSAEEVGCQSYTSASGITVTAKAKTKDACPTSCIGYDTFVQQANYFDIKRSAFFIPSTARTCNAQSVGCTSFTNLDALDKGGEAIEYYTQLRRCIKPDTSKCGQFYTWEGSDDSGYQIRVFSLNKVLNGASEEPKSTMLAADESQICNAAIFAKLPTEAGYNYDCREFYAQDGSVSYHLLANTITCSDNCHPYRREATQAECNLGAGDWDGTRCLYYAIPGEGTQCSAPQVGCQEYTGNVANNTRTLFTDTFEFSAVPTDNWTGGESSSIALNPGGRSLLARSRPVSKIVGNEVTRGTSYTISFLAKASGANTTVQTLALRNQNNVSADFATGSQVIKTDWQLYSFNLSSLDHEVTRAAGQEGEQLIIAFSGPVNLDNIKLTSVPNRYYLIKNSWNTPSECDQDFTGAPAAGYMLGCSQYSKDDRSTVALRSFSSLCQDSAAGCEAMIDTQNSSGAKAAGKTFYGDANNNGACEANEPNCFQKTAADRVVNVVYDPTKLCGNADKGCQRLATVSVYDNNAPTFSDVYIRNNPDAYDSVVCKANAVGCTQWSSQARGTVYFKDPGEQACEWRLKAGTASTYDWFKKGKDTPCDSTYGKTLGLGGEGNGVKQPLNWAGLCAVEQAGCSEYIDPLSKFNENIILNPSYQKSSGNENKAESWTSVSATEAKQGIQLIPQTLYILKDSTAATNPTRVKLDCGARTLQVLQADNSFAAKTEIPYGSGPSASRQFYVPLGATGSEYEPVSCTVVRRANPLEFNKGDEIYLRQAVTAYQLRQNLDRTSHNNLVNFDKGAILFNERSQAGVKKASLNFNADATYETDVNGTAPVAGTPSNANVLLKVQPDRVCSQWLDCITYIPDPSNPNKKICLDIGECQSLNPNGTCAVRVTPERLNRVKTNTAYANLTGYSKVGYDSASANGYYQFSAMTQVGGQIVIDDGGFESAQALTTQQGAWKVSTSGVQRVEGPKKVSELDLLPLTKVTQPRDVKFLAPEGLNVLKMMNDGVLTSKAYTFQTGARYVLSFYSYSRGGELNVQVKNTSSAVGDAGEASILIPRTDQPQKWTRRSIGFVASGPKMQLIFSSTGEVYLDDVKIDVSLNTNCSTAAGTPCTTPGNANAEPRYVAPSCRLYPTESAVDCSVKDDNQITTQGLKGYCLEVDPRNSGVCLLWYPVDRISSDAAEEGAEIKFDSKVYYCLDSADECVAGDPSKPQILDKPQLYCTKYVEVDTSKYWAGRLATNTTLELPQITPTATPAFPESPFFEQNNPPTSVRSIDLGGGDNRPYLAFPSIKLGNGDGFFGANYQSTREFGAGKEVFTPVATGTNPVRYKLPFVPYRGSDVSPKKCMSYAPSDPPFFNNIHTCFQGRCTNVRENKYGDFWVGTTQDYTVSKTVSGYDVCRPSYAIAADYDDDYGGATAYPENFQDEDDPWGFSDCSFFAEGEPCEVAVDGEQKFCSVAKEGSNWKLIADDGDDNLTDVGCFFSCYNRIKEVKIAAPAKPLDIIRRLFPQTQNWIGYSWNNGSYVRDQNVISFPGGTYPTKLYSPNQAGGKCPAPGGVPTRPSVDGNSNNDYCYIEPVISNYAINGASSGPISIAHREYKTFSFETKTDAEQLPIKKILVNFGYNVGKDLQGRYIPATYEFAGTNFADRLRTLTALYDYSQIPADYNNVVNGGVNGENCMGAEKCYLATPTIEVTDNWGVTTKVGNIKLIIKK